MTRSIIFTINRVEVKNVIGPGNKPEGWEYVGPTGSYRVDGATV